jgi:replicative DNA helicase
MEKYFDDQLLNTEAEQIILGSLLHKNDTYHVAAEKLAPVHFGEPMHGELYRAIASLIEGGKTANPTTLRGFMEARPAGRALGGAEYLSYIATMGADADELKQYVGLVHDLHVRRQLLVIARDAQEAAADGNLEVDGISQIEALERKLHALSGGSKSDEGFKTFADALDQATASAESAYRKDGAMVGVPTGLTILDNLLGGLHRSDLIVLAGRPSMGKTALATNIAYHAAAVHDIGVGIFSLEMSAEQLAARVLSAEAQIPSEKMRRGDVGEIAFDHLLTTADKLKKLPLYIDDTAGLTVSTLRTRAKKLKQGARIGLIVIDYLQLLASSGKADGRVNEVSEITRGLKTLAKELDVPVLALSQLSRAVEKRDDKRPQLSDLRESGSIEQDADVVMFVYRDHYYAERSEPSRADNEGEAKFAERVTQWNQRMIDSLGVAEVLVGKQRHGPTGMATVAFDGAFTRFSDRTSRL